MFYKAGRSIPLLMQMCYRKPRPSYAFLVCMYYTHYHTSIFGKNRVYDIQIFTMRQKWVRQVIRGPLGLTGSKSSNQSLSNDRSNLWQPIISTV